MKNLFKSLTILFLLNLFMGSLSYALPFSVVPQGSLPTHITAGQSVPASYTVINTTSKTAPGSIVKYLPLNVQVNSSPGSCGPIFSLQPFGTSGDRCTLQLSVSGAVNADDPDAHHHLFICRTGGVACAGTLFPLNVTLINLFSIILSPLNPSIEVGSTQQFTAIGNYSDGSASDITATVTWTSSNPTVATINNTGLATGLSSGVTTITATFGGVSAATVLTVNSSSGIAIAVGVDSPGNATLIGQTVNLGNSWSRVPFIITGALLDASCTGSGSTAICSAVGEDASQQPIIAQTLDGGQSWNRVTLSGFTHAELYSTSCAGVSPVYCVAGGRDFSSIPAPPLLFQTANSGATWNQVTVLGAPTSGIFNTVSCSLDNSLPRICIAAGRDFGIIPSPALVVQSTDNGNTWARVTITGLLVADSELFGASCTGSGPNAICMAVGANNSGPSGLLVQSLNDGAAWNVFTISGTPIGSNFVSVSCIGNGNTAHCVIAGQTTSSGTFPVLAQTFDGGTSWNFVDPLTISSNGFLTDVSCTATGATNFCIAVGADSTDPQTNLLTQSINGGTWTKVSLPGIVRGGFFQAASCTSVGSQAFCIASGFDGDGFPLIAQTTNSGTSWQVIAQNTFGTAGVFFGAGSSGNNFNLTKTFGIKKIFKKFQPQFPLLRSYKTSYNDLPNNLG